MRLERLEINGFKSFSDRSELAFDRGVTAIVGPNGCGKSNVADAITWVMGEQSAKSLRGDRMEDVIFNGSDARKPTATAEVRLRFSGVVKNVVSQHGSEEDGQPSTIGDGGGHAEENESRNGNGKRNSNGPPPHDVIGEIIQSVVREVEVTRRLYRSGESEYLIDGHTCRLRDIHDLLMDTGLGAKAYAIIEQGKIGLILSARPTDRRQLIEEAAGVTKYRARRRAAGLKLEAAQQNLTRVDDIIFEVDKQRGTLKRQAAKARRYRRLRDELRHSEKVLLARKYRQLADTIESARRRLTEARERESTAAAHVAEIESDLARIRIVLVEAEASATSAREAVHAGELEINRLQQQTAFDREQVRALDARIDTVAREVAALDARRGPALAALAAKRAAAAAGEAERQGAAAALTAESEAYDAAHRQIEGLEADVEGARGEVFSAINSATALRHSLEHATAARERVAETLSKLQVEADDLRIESERVETERAAAAEGLARIGQALEAARITRLARESELASARIEHEWRARAVRVSEHEIAGLVARLASLEELEAARAEYGDAARAVLAQANGRVNQQGAVADYLEVSEGYDRAVEACLGDLLQFVVVSDLTHAARGLDLVREQRAGRCGFIIAEPDTEDAAPALAGNGNRSEVPGLLALSSVVRVTGPFSQTIRLALGEAWIADSYERAAEASAEVSVPVATASGDLFRGPHLVVGGSPAEARGILETKRAILGLRAQIGAARNHLAELGDETLRFDASIALASNAIAALSAEHHRLEKTAVGYEAQLQRAADEVARLTRKEEQVARERRQAEEEREALDRRQHEGRTSVTRLEEAQRAADERLITAQRRLFEAREAAEELSRRVAEAGADHAALVERAAGLSAEVERFEEAQSELDTRSTTLAAELDEMRRSVDDLRRAIEQGEARLDSDIRRLDELRQDVQAADESVRARRQSADEDEARAKAARATLEERRRAVGELDVARATAESGLTHLAETAVETLQMTLEDLIAEVAAFDERGALTLDARVTSPEELEEEGDAEGGSLTAARGQGGGAVPEDDASANRELTAEEAILKLRDKIDRLGAVNMMAIEQFEELETRHTFLTSQRQDLVESISQTSEAIKRIDETTRRRFAEAFASINENFQETFRALFGGGRAGLTLIDESDPLESGIEIIAQPPGKRLQSVQLLSGGEKALTAIALMFGLFKYKPSPFCLLDEIDAPLDDANIARFVDMLRGMQRHTQFILITHNRKTMEIADRLYGVTMEEPGVSKLISVQLN
jgi:chromosome segregation protein